MARRNWLLPQESQITDPFQPLTVGQTWMRSYRLLWNEHWELFTTVTAAIVIPISILCCWMTESFIRGNFDDIFFFEIISIQCSVWLCQGVLSKLTVLIYCAQTTTTSATNTDLEGLLPGASPSQPTLEVSDLPHASQWADILVTFWSHHGCRKQSFAAMAVGVGASIGSLLASIFFYCPGVYYGVIWFLAPTVAFFHHHHQGGNIIGTSIQRPLHLQILTYTRKCMQESTDLVKGNRWKIWRMIVCLVCGYGFSMIPAAVLAAITHELVLGHVILGNQFVANLLGIGLYFVASLFIRIVGVSFLIIWKTTLYISLSMGKAVPSDESTKTADGGTVGAAGSDDNGTISGTETSWKEQKEVFLKANSVGWWTHRPATTTNADGTTRSSRGHASTNHRDDDAGNDDGGDGERQPLIEMTATTAADSAVTRRNV